MLLCPVHSSLESQLIFKISSKDNAVTALVVFLGLEDALYITPSELIFFPLFILFIKDSRKIISRKLKWVYWSLFYPWLFYNI